jgi:hypothetical protein
VDCHCRTTIILKVGSSWLFDVSMGLVIALSHANNRRVHLFISAELNNKVEGKAVIRTAEEGKEEVVSATGSSGLARCMPTVNEERNIARCM